MKNLLTAIIVISLSLFISYPSFSEEHNDIEKYEKSLELLKKYAENYKEAQANLNSQSLFRLVGNLETLKYTGAALEKLDPPADCGLTFSDPQSEDYWAKSVIGFANKALANGTFDIGYESMTTSNDLGRTRATRFKFERIRDFLEFFTVTPTKEAFLEMFNAQPIEDRVIMTSFGVFSEPHLLLDKLTHIVEMMSQQLIETESIDFFGPFGF